MQGTLEFKVSLEKVSKTVFHGRELASHAGDPGFNLQYAKQANKNAQTKQNQKTQSL
jgi:hypothetical protein